MKRTFNASLLTIGLLAIMACNDNSEISEGALHTPAFL